MPDLPDFLEPGTREEIGTVHFSAGDIVRFARKFDPQHFHLDPEVAKKSLLGGLCASGWHTASSWMPLQRRFVAQKCRQLEEQGKQPPEFGPSPGFTDLRWIKPVYAEDSITYHNEVESIRESKSRPGWWILTLFSQGNNQKEEPVISFRSTVFVKL